MKIAIITARAGSKRIPLKNIRNFLGKPIIAYTIEAALKSGLFEEVMVSTDSEKIAEISRFYGAKTPFLRSKKNSDDYATTADVIEEVLVEYQKIGKNFDCFCCIYPTAVFLTDAVLNDAYQKFISNNFDSLFPVVEYEVPIQIALEISNQGLLKMSNPEMLNVRTQDMIKHYYDPGQFYWSKTNSFLKCKNLFMEKTGSYLISPIVVQDIDNEENWKHAELKYKLLHGK